MLNTLSRPWPLLCLIAALSACAADPPRVGTTVVSRAAAEPPDAPRPTAQQPDFSGVWVLNPALSEAAPASVREAAQAERGGTRRGGGMGGGMGGGGHGGGMGGGGHGGGRGGQHAMRGDPESTRPALRPAQRLEIEHSPLFIAVSADAAPAQKVYTDYRSISVSASGGLAQRQTTAAWEGAKLVLETVSSAQGSFTETYELKPERGQLWVTLQTRAGADATEVSLRRVYEAQPDATGAAAP